MSISKHYSVLITGAKSMIGSAIFAALRSHNYQYIIPIDHSDGDLTDRIECDSIFERYQPGAVIHCAGYNGGIEFNKKYPSDIYYQTAMMGLNVLNACEFYGVKKIVSLMPSCSYPSSDKILYETDFGSGNSHPSVECHGHAKRVLFDYSRQIYKQTEGKCLPVCAVSNNSFGPGDSYDLEKTKFIGAVVKKIVDAKHNNEKVVNFWGTGKPLREFVYSQDIGQYIVDILEKYNNPFEVINIGGTELSIRQVVAHVSMMANYEGKITWDDSKPDGQMRKKLDSTKLSEITNHVPTDFDEALIETIRDYENRYLTR
jgi:GDP-L-fucose synthase